MAVTEGLTITLNGKAQQDATRIIAACDYGISEQEAVRRALSFMAEMMDHVADGGHVILKGGAVRGQERVRFF